MSAAVELVVAVAIGAGLGAAGWRATSPMFRADAVMRTNYRGQLLPTAVGVVIPLVALVVIGSNSIVAVILQLRDPFASGWSALSELGPTMLLTCLGFGCLGLLDDVAGINQSGGFSGHLRAMARGTLTTGMVKLIGGALLSSVIVARTSAEPSLGGFVRDVGIISLGANLANLADRAPGRAIKAVTLGFAVVAGVTLSELLVAPAVVIGAGFGLLSADLREDLMLGDTGSNVLGATLGLGVVFAVTPGVRWGVFALLVALNALSEVKSFTSIIDATPALRWLDRLGAPHRQP